MSCLIHAEELGRPGKSEARLESILLDREDVSRPASLSGVTERDHHRCFDHTAVRKNALRARLRNRVLLGQFGQERPLMVVLLGARQLQRVAHSEFQGQIGAYLPTVFDKTGRRIPLVVIGNQNFAERGLVVNAEQELSELDAASAIRPTIAVAQCAIPVELVSTAGGAEERNRLQSLLKEIGAELPGFIPAHPRDGVCDFVAMLGILVLLRLAKADRADASRNFWQAARGDAWQSKLGREVPPCQRIEHRRKITREPAIRVIDAQLIDNIRREGMGICKQDLLRPTVVGAPGVDLVPANLEITATTVTADRHLRVASGEMVLSTDLMIDPDGHAFFKVLDKRGTGVVR